MAKRKRTNNDLQNTTQKRSSNTNPTKTGVNSGALERYRMWPKVLAHLKQNLYVINQNHIFERFQNRPPLWLTIGLGNRSSGVYMQNSTNTTVNQWHNSWWGPTRLVHSIRLFFRKSEKSTIIRNLAVRHHFVSYLVFFLVFVWTQDSHIEALHRY